VPGPTLSPEFSPVIESTEFGPQLPASRGFGNRLANLFPHHDLIRTDRRLHLEGGHAGVLADGAFVFDGEVDVFRDDASAWADCVPGTSCDAAAFMAERTSGGDRLTSGR
jgi:hypothetical protein